ncbi:DUF433 domain-containing protein [Chitinophaga ginsengisoli]|uniref:Uncharacterized protein (DUF433 family) n=1 Tax=Chitinophaga ginsengisoli TaxID=363837 RepID=A0A2P8FAQ8_9BACT|nr:DUF433 domain-containing protein [Chitinophaga ginsengisoli]PSL18816.1 uncharacterized protein (DUF433 family) [Chitinophaga ginsengisoli]
MRYIEIRKDISSGAPVVKGRRTTVFNIVSCIYYEDNLQEALDSYEIILDVAREAVAYCSELKCQEDVNLFKFCSGCVLRALQEDWNFSKDDYKEILLDEQKQIITISKDGNSIFLGSLQELEITELGEAGWLVAQEIKRRYPVLSADV